MPFIVSFVSQSCFSSQDWTLGAQGGTNLQAIQANFQRWLSGPKTPGLVVLEHELSDGAVQSFITAFPLIKQFNWDLKSVVELGGQGAYQNAADDTSQPTFVPLTAGGNGGAGLIAAATPTSSSSTPAPPSPTTSSNSTNASASPESNAKSGAAPGLDWSPIMMSVSTLALVFSLYLI
jgi:chitin deacetylase